jgi:hypothetical protein
MASEQLQQDMHAIEHNLARLVNDYEGFLCGATAKDPKTLETQTERLISKWRVRPIGRTVQRFKFQNLVQRFDCYKESWERQRREKQKREYVF